MIPIPVKALEPFYLNVGISGTMINYQNLFNGLQDFKDTKQPTPRIKVDMGLTLKKRLRLNAPPPAPSAILFRTLKRHFPRFKARMHIGMRLSEKITNQKIAYQPNNKPKKANPHTSQKQIARNP